MQSSPVVRSLSLLGPSIVLSEVVRELRIEKILSWVYQSYCNIKLNKNQLDAHLF
jgi:hypothetical protein